MIVSSVAFDWFLSGILFGSSFGWFLVDIVRLRRALRARASTPGSPETHDRVFGSIIGLIMCSAGMAGVIMHHLG